MSYVNNSYPEAPAPSFYSAAGKAFVGGFAYTNAASSTEEKALLLSNRSGSGKQVQLVDFRASVLTIGTAVAATSVIVKFYMVDNAGLSASGTSATCKNLLFGGAASVATYHTSATATATATTALPLKIEVSNVGGTKELRAIEQNPLIIPEGYSLQASVTSPAGSVPAVGLDFTIVEI